MVPSPLRHGAYEESALNPLIDQHPPGRHSPVAPRGGGTTFCWHGWYLSLPHRWNPLKLEGDYDSGYAGFADLLQQRLGIRWQKHKAAKFDAEKWARKTLRQELGVLAADEAVPAAAPSDGEWRGCFIYHEPEPPGRDIWTGYSVASGRGIVLSYHARRRDRALAGSLVPKLADLPTAAPMPWSVFELSCIVPVGFVLRDHRLHAGDLSLTFTRKRDKLIIRQLAVAQLALQRLPLEKWLVQQQQLHRKHYRPAGKSPEPISFDLPDRTLEGLSRQRRRRIRFSLMRSLPRDMITLALHDAQRDRLAMIEASSPSLARDLAQSLGWATQTPEP